MTLTKRVATLLFAALATIAVAQQPAGIEIDGSRGNDFVSPADAYSVGLEHGRFRGSEAGYAAAKLTGVQEVPGLIEVSDAQVYGSSYGVEFERGCKDGYKEGYDEGYSKGLSEKPGKGAGFALGFFLGIIGVIIAAVI